VSDFWSLSRLFIEIELDFRLFWHRWAPQSCTWTKAKRVKKLATRVRAFSQLMDIASFLLTLFQMGRRAKYFTDEQRKEASRGYKKAYMATERCVLRVMNLVESDLKSF
jgi:hypothetical protein